jgi:hypothetical protein
VSKPGEWQQIIQDMHAKLGRFSEQWQRYAKGIIGIFIVRKSIEWSRHAINVKW